MAPVDESKRATLRRFAALGAASPVLGLGEMESRSDAPPAIVGYLETTPGAHFSKLRDDLGLGTGETQHHLRRLEDAGAIESRRDGDYRRFFPAGQFTEYERVALGYLRRPTPRGIVMELLRRPDASAGDVADALDVSTPSVSKQAAELEAAGLLVREDAYRLVDPETLLVLLVRYAGSFGPEAVALAGDAAGLISVDE